jgi:hypothetical protein
VQSLRKKKLGFGGKVMPEYINIISQEAIKAVPNWLVVIGGFISIAAVLSTFIYWGIVKDPDKVLRYLTIVAPIAIVFVIAWMCITCLFFSEPTGKYRYEAAIDKDKITVSQYEEFLDEYNPTIRDGVYYFEGGALDE